MRLSTNHLPHTLGYGIILLAAVLYGTFGIWSRLMGDSFDPFYQAWVRSIIIMLLMLPLLLATKAFRKIERQDWPQVGLYVAFSLFTQAPLYYAFNHASIGAAQLIFYAVFVITAYIAGRVYLGERITKIKLASMILAFIGLAFVFGTSVLSFAPLGLALAALNGAGSGGEAATSKKISDKYPPGLLVFWAWVFTLLTHLPLSLFLGETQPTPALSAAWGYLLIFSVVNAAAFWLIIEGFRRVDASIGSLIGLTEVIFAIIFAALIFDEGLTWSVAIGGVCIILASMLPDAVNIIRAKHTRRSVEPVRKL